MNKESLEKDYTMIDFTNAIKSSLMFQDNLTYYKTQKYYYHNQYAKPIKEYFAARNIKSLETNPNSKNGLISICSAASSARLCFLYFAHSVDNVVFEKPLYNDVSKTPTKMDAVDGNIFFECKCQEIVYGEKEVLKQSYEESFLFKEFNIKNYKVEKRLRTKDGKKQDEYYLTFSMRDLSIDIEKNYNELHFNVKQLLCHLMALANLHSPEEVKLQYIIFRPSNEQINNSNRVSKVYEELDTEVKKIWKSKNIQQFCKTHKIVLPTPMYVSIDSIDDFVYREAFLKDSSAE